MTHLGIPEGSPGAAGWTMAFDKLVVHLGGLGPVGAVGEPRLTIGSHFS